MSKVDTILDTLEVTSDFFSSKSAETQYYKGLQKYKTNEKIYSIIDYLGGDEDQKRYWKTYHCNRIILQEGSVLRGSLCRKKWCTHCARIKTAELTNGYQKPLEDLGNLYFITLTRPNVKGSKLKSEIKKMIKCFQRIKDNMRKNYGMKIEGLRKIEVTYNQNNDTYHPHFHFIQSNYAHSQQLLQMWVDSNPTAKKIAQDIRPIDSNGFKELFKYATKETTKSGEQYSGEVLHTIYDSLEGIRAYQTYGSLRKIKEPAEEKTEVNECNFLPHQTEVWEYSQHEKTWVDTYSNLMINTNFIENELSRKKREGKAKNSKSFSQKSYHTIN